MSNVTASRALHYATEGLDMITITDTAASKVKELLEEQGKSDHALRIFVRGMSCSGPAYGMALDDDPRTDDTVEEFEGVRILVDPVSAEYVEGAEVDFVDGLMGRGFTVRNPTLQTTGGCGSGCSCGGH
jgi:iron-sulfur cluster assembly accessory protein